MSNATILVVDDEELIRWSLREGLQNEGYEILEAGTGKEALDKFKEGVDLVLLDYRLPDIDGLTVLREMRKLDPGALVILLTSLVSVETAVEAMKSGAYHFANKPFNMEDVSALVSRALETTRLRREVRQMRENEARPYTLRAIVGESEAMESLRQMIAKVAASPASTVLLTGESGTGKDLVAKTIHYTSNRASRPFMNITCSALPEQLLESELFGHERGAFTGADTLKRGLMEHASGGTFFLDEICEMSLELQAKLLRALQERKVRRVGGDVEIPVDIRVIAATNRDPQEAVEQGILREDLFFRLNVVPVKVPPLRERRDDIPLLAEHFLRRYAQQYERDADTPLRLSADAMRALVAYRWPGNVRQLQNTMERVVSLATPGQEITAADLPEEITGASGPGAPTMVFATDLPFHVAKEEAIEAFERQYLEALLQRHGGNISQAAREAEIDRKTIHRLLKKYSIRARAGLN